jgi:hypothetical protein
MFALHDGREREDGKDINALRWLPTLTLSAGEDKVFSLRSGKALDEPEEFDVISLPQLQRS